MTGCPLRDRWQTFLDQRLAEEEERVLHEHVERCADCAATLHALIPSDNTPRPPAFAEGEGAPPTPPELLARLYGLWPTTAADGASAPAAWPALEGYEILGVLGQ